MPKTDPRNPREIFNTPLELQTAGKILTLGWMSAFESQRKDPNNPTKEELKREVNIGNNFSQRLQCWAEAYHQLRQSGEITAENSTPYDEKEVKAEREAWRDMYESTLLFNEEEDDQRFK